MTKTKNLGKISELIFQAVEMGNVTELKTLIENEVNIKMKNEYGWTLLHVASMKGNLEVVKCLLENGAVVDPKVLSFAIKNNQTHVVKYLIQNGVNINAKSSNMTPLQLAIQSDRFEIVNLLIENGASINTKVKHEFTALYDLASISN